MKRSAWITGLTLIQLLLALTMLSGGIYLLLLARSPDILNSKDGAAVARGLRIAAALFVPIALVSLISAYGLWRDKLWGWWLGFIVSLGAAATFVYSVIDDGWKNSDPEDIAFPIVFLVLLVLYGIPAVRGYYWRRDHSKPDEIGRQAKRA
jgi:hypothetical protein